MDVAQALARFRLLCAVCSYSSSVCAAQSVRAPACSRMCRSASWLSSSSPARRPFWQGKLDRSVLEEVKKATSPDVHHVQSMEVSPGVFKVGPYWEAARSRPQAESTDRACPAGGDGCMHLWTGQPSRCLRVCRAACLSQQHPTARAVLTVPALRPDCPGPATRMCRARWRARRTMCMPTPPDRRHVSPPSSSPFRSKLSLNLLAACRRPASASPPPGSAASPRNCHLLLL